MTQKKKSPAASLVRSSAAEYLTFVAASGGGGVEAVYADENVWLSQKMMAQLYDVEVPTINYHLKKVFSDSELEEEAVIRRFRITASDGKTYDTKHYNLSAIIAVGYKVNSERAVQFRKWATRIIEEFTIKGFAMDDERLARGGSVLSDRYFEEQLQRVREIRISERKFYRRRGHSAAQDPDDHAGLGGAAEPLPRRNGSRGAFGRRKGHSRDCQGTRRERVREVPHRAGPVVRERLRPRRRQVQAPREEDGHASQDPRWQEDMSNPFTEAAAGRMKRARADQQEGASARLLRQNWS
jgi:hypothetical protein